MKLKVNIFINIVKTVQITNLEYNLQIK